MISGLLDYSLCIGSNYSANNFNSYSGCLSFSGEVMGCQTPTSNERLRTFWTPKMERYFIDLMLDHMHRGDRVGHTFNKQAWADMLTMFSAKFGPQPDKDILKYHYSTLWKQFNNVKNLLEQNGFSWDDTQQMVVADDYVWDAYIKAHPDAQYYKNRSLMNFNELCLIYAYIMADGRYSRSSHDVDFDDEIQGANIGDGKEAQTPTFSNCTKTYWTPPMDHYLIELLFDQVVRGNKIGHAFITQAWNEMVNLFNLKFGSHHDKEVLKSRYKHLKQQYNEAKILLSHSGFSWDETREMVTAEEYIWDSYTKAFPDAQFYRFNTVPSYQKLCVIFGKEGSNGRPSHMAPNEDPSGVDIKCNADGDYSRAFWTPSMDRYLLDLLLKHVHNGHKFNPVFNKQAWIDIVASFNDRFGSQHDKYVLKGQFRSMKKLYNDIENLLEQGEFSWDESRQIVTGPDDAWDAYSKEHPDATSFRTGTMPNYNDLCVVYGNLTCERRSNQSDPFVGLNGDVSQKSNYLRSGWTPAMDRYFIDLMLEQIRKGNMVHQIFNKQAWDDVVAKFAAKFGPHHHSDGLKICLEKMRNLFYDMRNLIDQSGFAWDEMQQMVAASDDIWDAYIKAYPDAQSYRNRTLPNYNDLFLIYGNASTNGRHDHAGRTDLDNDALIVNISQEDDQCSSGSDTVGITWTKPMDRFFIDLMLGQVLEGNKVDNTFNKQAWDCMITSFNAKFGLQWNNSVLENQYLSLMKQYNDINFLLNQNGFAWDEMQQKVTADDTIWEAYVQEHPDAVAYKDIILENYNDLSVIFGDKIQDGTSRYVSPEMDIFGRTPEMGMNGIFGALRSPARDDHDIEASSRRKRSRSTTPLTSTRWRKAKKTRRDELQEADRSSTPGKSKNYSSIESIVGALQAIPDMDDELFLNACNLLEDEKKAWAFVKMDVPHRKKWLRRNLHAS